MSAWKTGLWDSYRSQRLEFDPQMNGKGRSAIIELSWSPGCASQSIMLEQRLQDRGNKHLVDMSAKAGVKSVSPKNIFVPRASGPERLRIRNAQPVEHRREICREHHARFRHFDGPQGVGCDDCVA